MKNSNSLPSSPTKTLDPLYVIFEQHLFNFQDSDSSRKAFVGNIVKDYLTYLRKMSIIIPKSLEDPIIEELSAQVNTMLVKKIYGCLSIEDYQEKVPSRARRKAKAKYSELSRRATKVARAKAG